MLKPNQSCCRFEFFSSHVNLFNLDLISLSFLSRRPAFIGQEKTCIVTRFYGLNMSEFDEGPISFKIILNSGLWKKYRPGLNLS